MLFALIVIVLAAGYRIVAAWDPNLVNFSPLMALAFCGGVYFRNRWLWLVPLAALALSDLYLDHYYAEQFGYAWSLGGMLIRTACFAIAIGLGWMVAQRKSWLNLFSGALGGAIIFYLVTNTAAWARDRGVRRVVAVSHYYHQPRVKLLFERAGLRTFTVPATMRRRLLKEPYYIGREVLAYYAALLFDEAPELAAGGSPR